MSNIIAVKEKYIIECAKLYVKVFNDKPWNDDWNVESAYRRLHDIFIAPNFEGVLYMKDEEVLGAIFGNYEQYYNGMHYYLREMFVANESQGLGIGSQILDYMEDMHRKNKVTTTYLFTSQGNRTSDFYQKNGYKIWTGMAMMGKHYENEE